MPPKRRRSRRPRRTPPASPLAHIPWQPIRNRMAPLTRLQPEEEARIHAASLRILEEIGIAFMDPEALDLWVQAGAQVDRSEQIVRLDRGLLQELVSRAPRQFTWRARNPENATLVFLCELGPPPYAITGADGKELSDRWEEALTIKSWVETIWAELEQE